MHGGGTRGGTTAVPAEMERPWAARGRWADALLEKWARAAVSSQPRSVSTAVRSIHAPSATHEKVASLSSERWPRAGQMFTIGCVAVRLAAHVRQCGSTVQPPHYRRKGTNPAPWPERLQSRLRQSKAVPIQMRSSIIVKARMVGAVQHLCGDGVLCGLPTTSITM